MCFVAYRLDVVAVVQLPWRLCSVTGAAEFRVSFFVCFSSNALGLLQVCTRVKISEEKILMAKILECVLKIMLKKLQNIARIEHL